MGLTKKYLVDHASTAKIKSAGQKCDYEAFGRAVADLIMRSAADSDALKDGGEVDKIDLSGITITLTENHTDICVDVQVCLPVVGCTTAHIGA